MLQPHSGTLTVAEFDVRKLNLSPLMCAAVGVRVYRKRNLSGSRCIRLSETSKQLEPLQAALSSSGRLVLPKSHIGALVEESCFISFLFRS